MDKDIYILCEYLWDYYNALETNIYIHNSLEEIHDKQSQLLCKRIEEYQSWGSKKIIFPDDSTFDELLTIFNNTEEIRYISKIIDASKSIGKMTCLNISDDETDSSWED